MYKKKVKIAIIDTGIDSNDEEIKNNIRFDKKLQISKFEEVYNNIDDENGHGTFCAKTILSICEDSLIYPIKIFDNNGKSSSWNLIEALENIVNTDIDIINISASSTNCPCEKELAEVCKKLYKEGKIIVCSHNNSDDNPSTPTKFNTVIGVRGNIDIFKDEDYIYMPQNEVQIYGNSKDKLIMFKGKITHFGRNSRAAAVFSGIIANFIKINKYNSNSIKKIIAKNSIDIKSLDDFKYTKYTTYNEKEIEIAEKILKIINDEFAVKKVDLDFLKEYSIMNTFTEIGRFNAYEFLTRINNEFKINIDYKCIFIYELDYLNKIVKLISENIKK